MRYLLWHGPRPKFSQFLAAFLENLAKSYVGEIPGGLAPLIHPCIITAHKQSFYRYLSVHGGGGGVLWFYFLLWTAPPSPVQHLPSECILLECFLVSKTAFPQICCFRFYSSIYSEILIWSLEWRLPVANPGSTVILFHNAQSPKSESIVILKGLEHNMFGDIYYAQYTWIYQNVFDQSLSV